ncbi:MAG: response regulator [Candidatus Rifleibacteriota bacterium]
MKILVTDDDKTSRILLKAVLQKWNYDIVEAENGLEAWNVVSDPQSPQILLIDWMMPQMTGLELCRKINEELDRERFYILILTARGDKQDMIAALDAGADDFISKPWNNEELRARVNVGARMLKLQQQVAKRQKLQGILEMAGSVCHELNQPLQVAMGYSDMLLMDLEETSKIREPLERIVDSVNKMGELTGKILKLTDSQSISYIDGYSNIIDIHKSTE